MFSWVVDFDHSGVSGGVDRILLQGRRKDADPERLAEDDAIADAGIGIAFDQLRMDQSEGDQAVDRLDRIDAVAAGNRDPGGAADRFAAGEDARDDLCRQHVDRHADQRQRHDRPAAHGIDVGNGVGGRDAPEVVGVVDDGHEEIGGGDQRLFVIELVDGGIVRGFDADQQLGRYRQAVAALEDFRQQAGGDLAATSAPVRQGGQAGGIRCHGHFVLRYN